MNFRKWIFEHGPGSAGKTVETISKTYRAIKKSHPQASGEDLLRLTLSSRVSAYQVTKMYPPLTDEQQERWIEMADGSLYGLIYLIFKYEYPQVPRDVWNSFEVIGLIHELIDKNSI